MSSPDLSQPGDPSVTSTAIELETITTLQVEEDTEASRAKSNKKSNAEAKPTSKYKLELIINPKS